MTDVALATLKDTLQGNLESLFSLVGIPIVDAPLSPPSHSYQVPVTSLDVPEVNTATLEAQARVNHAVNRAFDEVMGVIKLGAPPKGARVIISVSRKSFMYHIYLTVETFHV